MELTKDDNLLIQLRHHRALMDQWKDSAMAHAHFQEGDMVTFKKKDGSPVYCLITEVIINTEADSVGELRLYNIDNSFEGSRPEDQFFLFNVPEDKLVPVLTKKWSKIVNRMRLFVADSEARTTYQMANFIIDQKALISDTIAATRKANQYIIDRLIQKYETESNTTTH